MDPHRDARLGLGQVDCEETFAHRVDREETFAQGVDREETLAHLVDPEETFAHLVDRLSVLVARLSNEEFRRLICAMAQARATARRHQQSPPMSYNSPV